MGSMRRTGFRAGALALTSLLAVTGSATVTANATAAAAGRARDVLLVGNNWEGTVDVVDVERLQSVRRINVVPDRVERMREINADPIRWAVFQFIRAQIGEGHDQFVDDTYASADGTEMYVSRPSFGDVVAITVADGQVRWRTRVAGYRADHMALSPDGTRLVVSASTANVGQVIDTATGAVVGSFATGDQPHENTYSRDGGKIFNASIGSVYTPLDEPWLDWTKGDRYLQILDAASLRVLHRIRIREKLAHFGMDGMSSSVRPMALSPDERFLYLQVSFFHGFVEYDLQQDRVTRVAHLPVAEETRNLRRDQYLLDSAHHGIAMSGDGTKLCVAGTMSNYAAIVARDTFRYRIHPLGPQARTYWATTSADGRFCYVSVAGDDTVSVISYASEQEVARIPVGDHPQRARTGRLLDSVLG
jgi:YVTN family beta-propeller protein